MPVHSFLLSSGKSNNDNNISSTIESTKSKLSLSISSKSNKYFGSSISTSEKFLDKFKLLIEENQFTISNTDYDGQTVIDIILKMNGEEVITDDVLLLTLQKWFLIYN